MPVREYDDEDEPKPRTIRGREVPQAIERAIGRALRNATEAEPVTAAFLTDVAVQAAKLEGLPADREWCGRVANALLRDAKDEGRVKKVGEVRGHFASTAPPRPPPPPRPPSTGGSQ